jgi:hypothetical protein
MNQNNNFSKINTAWLKLCAEFREALDRQIAALSKFNSYFNSNNLNRTESEQSHIASEFDDSCKCVDEVERRMNEFRRIHGF